MPVGLCRLHAVALSSACEALAQIGTTVSGSMRSFAGYCCSTGISLYSAHKGTVKEPLVCARSRPYVWSMPIFFFSSTQRTYLSHGGGGLFQSRKKPVRSSSPGGMYVKEGTDAISPPLPPTHPRSHRCCDFVLCPVLSSVTRRSPRCYEAVLQVRTSAITAKAVLPVTPPR